MLMENILSPCSTVFLAKVAWVKLIFNALELVNLIKCHYFFFDDIFFIIVYMLISIEDNNGPFNLQFWWVLRVVSFLF